MAEPIVAGMYEGMSQIEPMLRKIPAVRRAAAVADDASVVDKFIAFIDRDHASRAES